MRNLLLFVVLLAPVFVFSQQQTSAIPDSLLQKQDELTELKQRYNKYYTQKKGERQAKADKKTTYVWKEGKSTQDFRPSKKVVTTTEQQTSYAHKPKRDFTKKGKATNKKDDAWKKKLSKGLKKKS